MTDDIDYSNHPKSITEIRSDKSGNPSDWTPRDALISVLRDIDNGEINPQYALILFGSVNEENGVETKFYNATPNRYIHNGLIEDHKRRLAVKDATGNY